MDKNDLLQQARTSKKSAYAPYSCFPVGAALLAKDGRVFLGANVENSSYGLTICAERVAVTAAVTAGAKDFAMLAISTDAKEVVPPCGACLQVLAEFADDLPIILDNNSGEPVEVNLRQLLPMAFNLTKGE